MPETPNADYVRAEREYIAALEDECLVANTIMRTAGPAGSPERMRLHSKYVEARKRRLDAGSRLPSGAQIDGSA